MENDQQKTSRKRSVDQAHRRQYIWQILLPILVAVLAALVIGILAIIAAGSTGNRNSQWAMISTIFIVLPWLIFSLVPLALLVLGIWLLSKSRKSVSPYLAASAHLSDRLRLRASGIAQVAAAPFIRARSVNAGFLHLLKMAFHLDTTPKE